MILENVGDFQITRSTAYRRRYTLTPMTLRFAVVAALICLMISPDVHGQRNKRKRDTIYPVAVLAFQERGDEVEGYAAKVKRPTAVLSGEATFMGMAVLASFVALSLEIPGIFIAPVGLLAGNLAAFAVIVGVLRWYTIRDVTPTWMNAR